MRGFSFGKLPPRNTVNVKRRLLDTNSTEYSSFFLISLTLCGEMKTIRVNKAINRLTSQNARRILTFHWRFLACRFVVAVNPTKHYLGAFSISTFFTFNAAHKQSLRDSMLVIECFWWNVKVFRNSTINSSTISKCQHKIYYWFCNWGYIKIEFVFSWISLVYFVISLWKSLNLNIIQQLIETLHSCAVEFPPCVTYKCIGCITPFHQILLHFIPMRFQMFLQ